MTIRSLFLTSPVPTARIAGLAHDLGLALTRDGVPTGGFRSTSWRDTDERFLVYVRHAASGLGELRVQGDDLVEACRRALDLVDPERLVADATEPRSTADAVRANFVLCGIIDSFADESVQQRASAVLLERLSDERDLVRWSASRIMELATGDDVIAAYEAAVATYPDLASDLAVVRERSAAEADGTLHDAPTDAWHELVWRARRGLEDGQPRRAERATEALLEDAPYHAEALLLRGLAYEALGETALALGLVGASLASQQADPDDSSSLPDLLAETEDAFARLQQAVGADVPVDDRFASEADRWLALFDRTYHAECRAGFAAALVDRVPEEHAALYRFIVGRYHGDAELLARVVEAHPRSVAAHAALADVTRDPGRQRDLYARALDLWGAGSSDPIDEHEGETSGATLLAALARIAYDAQDWDEAARLGDELVASDPRSTYGWQVRANARTFGLRHPEAVVAYEEALAALDEVMSDGDSVTFGDDPRPAMRFNLSCVLAKLGRRDDALDALRRAVRGDAQWAASAATDDYWEAYFDDDDFRAITRLEPRALVLDGELERSHIDALVTRALGRTHTGQIDEALDAAAEAIHLAQVAGFVDLQIRALAVQGRTIALYDDPHVGLEVIEGAMALLDDHPDIEASIRASAHHDHGTALHVARVHDRARHAYEQSLAIRVDIHGADHPVLAKCYGDLSRLAHDVGDEDEADALIARAIAVLDAYFAADPDPEDDRWADALVDRATLWSNRAFSALKAGDLDVGLDCLDHAVPAIEAVYAAGYTAHTDLERAETLLGWALQNAENERQIAATRALRARIEDLLLDPDPEVRAEQVFWRGLRRFVRRMLAQGVQGEVLADTLTRALRGEPLPDVLRDTPEVGGLAEAFAKRAERVPSFIVLAVLALQTAAADGNIDAALERLEGICVASIGVDPDELY